MLSTSEFRDWAAENVVLFLHNTSRVATEPYPNLLREKGGNGFPTVSYLDASGRLLKQVGHVTPVAELDAALEELRKWQELSEAVAFAESPPRADAERLFRMELAMGVLDPVAARVTANEMFDGEQRADLEQALVNLEFVHILRQTPPGDDGMAMAGRRFVDMYRLDRIPTANQETSFWQYMFKHASAEGDADLFEELLEDLKVRREGDPRLARYMQQLERELEALKR